MIVKLWDKSVVIEDINQRECIELENYNVKFNGVAAQSSIYMLDIIPENSLSNIITIRSCNLIVIDKRSKK